MAHLKIMDLSSDGLQNKRVLQLLQT